MAIAPKVAQTNNSLYEFNRMGEAGYYPKLFFVNFNSTREVKTGLPLWSCAREIVVRLCGNGRSRVTAVTWKSRADILMVRLNSRRQVHTFNLYTTSGYQ